MNIYQKARDGYIKSFREYDEKARSTPDYMTLDEAKEAAANARDMFEKAVTCHSYGSAHDALWDVMCTQSRLDAILFPKG